MEDSRCSFHQSLSRESPLSRKNIESFGLNPKHFQSKHIFKKLLEKY
ncbi:hypothetical protein B4135_2512 [Caldibacillus debilis]|uniref:Uncharacterized protein n=1 Tax=Caldibacillus debilis TaxID=301148 RepID=A0A150LYU9_9BACI|nr:hypothetical protein B4135_2512 [Caldibacillus debilis]